MFYTFVIIESNGVPFFGTRNSLPEVRRLCAWALQFNGATEARYFESDKNGRPA